MTLSKDAIVTALKNNIPQLNAAYLFGSAATDTMNSDSDIDIAFLSHTPLSDLIRWELAQQLATELSYDVDLINLDTASTVLRYQIITTGEQIYAKKPHELATKEVCWIAMYLDLNDTRATLLTHIKQEGTVLR